LAAKGLLFPLSYADSRPRQESNLRLAKYPLPSPPAKVLHQHSVPADHWIQTLTLFHGQEQALKLRHGFG
jgi:hypothetical protein